jgi:hypothetical protein
MASPLPIKKSGKEGERKRRRRRKRISSWVLASQQVNSTNFFFSVQVFSLNIHTSL